MNNLKASNCNKAKCKSCMFGPTPVELTPDRITEIHRYLANFEASHICHTTNKTCVGALEFQAKILCAMKVISKPTVKALLLEAEKYIINDTTEGND